MRAGHARVVPVTVVVPPRTLLLDIAGPIEALRKANEVQDTVRFAVSYVGPAPAVISSVGLSLCGIAPLPPWLPEDGLLVVSGSASQTMNGSRSDAPREAADEAAIVAWLRSTIGPRTRIACICSGALLAARAGLLAGRACTTHHACLDELATLAPDAQVLANRLYVEDGPCLTSAGITAGIDLMLHLIGQMAGPAAALAVARYLVVYLRRAGADPQLSPWLEGRNHIHPAIHRVQDAVVADPARAWSLEDLAHLAHASPRHLSRLFNAQAGMSVTDYLNRVRVALARTLVEETRLDMERVAERCGFASPRQLRRAWARFHPHAPSRVRTARSGRQAPGATGPQASGPTPA